MNVSTRHLSVSGAALFLLSTLNTQLSTVLAQGPLAPPGAPAPTLKTLQQVEPRTDLQAIPAPAGVDTSNASYHFIVNQPGSYYLSANLAVTKTHGIQINAAGVTLDLLGFRISRASGAGGNGIEIVATANGASVRNGSIHGFADGITTLIAGVDRAYGCAFRDLAVSGCTSDGIRTGDGATLESCRAHDNSGSSGITANTGSTLINCTANNNTAQFGLSIANGSTLSNCSAYQNVGSVGISGGIATSSGCTIIGCTAKDNGSTAASTATTGMGFRINSQCTIQNCTASGNRGSGIYLVGDQIQASGNTCAGNTLGGQGGGIHADSLSSACRIDGNHVSGGTRGIFVEGSDNLIIRNSAQGATAANYDIAAGNHDAARVTSPGAAFASTSPWVNFSF